MPKERNKADGYREKAPIKREKSDVFIDSSEREVSRPKVKAYEGDTKATNQQLTIARNTVTNGIEMTEALLYYLIVINVVTFLVYGIDKWKAKKGSWRISEATLLILAAIGGSIGALLGMKIWHHKTMHKKFKYGLPLILLAQIATIYFIS